MQPALLSDLGPFGALLAFLLAGHCLGDFVLQARSVVLYKERWSMLLLHAGIVALVQAALLLPVVARGELALLAGLGLGLLHGIVDRLLREMRELWPGRGLLLDQTLHLTALALAGWLLRDQLPGSWLDGLGPEAQARWIAVAVLGSLYAVNGTGAAALLTAMLAPFRPTDDTHPGLPERGRAIGILERMLLVTLVLLDQWGALGLVIAAKSVARFEAMKDRDVAEYYLIGTLGSVLFATLSTLLARALI